MYLNNKKEVKTKMFNPKKEQETIKNIKEAIQWFEEKKVIEPTIWNENDTKFVLEQLFEALEKEDFWTYCRHLKHLKIIMPKIKEK